MVRSSATQTGSKKHLASPFLISNLPLACLNAQQLSKRIQIWVPGGSSHTRYLLGMFQSKRSNCNFWSSRQVGSFAKPPMTSHKSRSMVQHSTCQAFKVGEITSDLFAIFCIQFCCFQSCYDFKVIFKLRTSRPLQLKISCLTLLTWDKRHRTLSSTKPKESPQPLATKRCCCWDDAVYFDLVKEQECGTELLHLIEPWKAADHKQVLLRCVEIWKAALRTVKYVKSLEIQVPWIRFWDSNCCARPFFCASCKGELACAWFLL